MLLQKLKRAQPRLFFVDLLKALAQHLGGLADDDKSVGVHRADQLLELPQLPGLDAGHQHPFGRPGVHAGAVEVGDSPGAVLQQQIGQYLQLVVGAMEYPVSFSEGEYVLPLLKALKCQPVLDGVHPLERLMQYIELYSGLMKEQCFVLVDAHAYFSNEELQQLYRMAGYQKWRLLLLEQRLAAPLPAEDICLLDASLCELRLDSDPEIR